MGELTAEGGSGGVLASLGIDPGSVTVTETSMKEVVYFMNLQMTKPSEQVVTQDSGTFLSQFAALADVPKECLKVSAINGKAIPKEFLPSDDEAPEMPPEKSSVSGSGSNASMSASGSSSRNSGSGSGSAAAAGSGSAGASASGSSSKSQSSNGSGSGTSSSVSGGSSSDSSSGGSGSGEASA